MPGFLKQSTASQSRALGPFVDDTDFTTVETGLTIANTDVKLVKNGGTSVNKNSGGGTHRVNGVYSFTFDATDTDTVGELEVSILVAGALVVFDKFSVIEEAIYDALFGASATGLLPANVTQLNGQATSAQNLERSASAIYQGTVGASPTTTTLADAGLTQADTDHWKGRIIIFTSGDLAFQATDITAFTPATDTLTFTALTSAPAQNDTYVIV